MVDTANGAEGAHLQLQRVYDQHHDTDEHRDWNPDGEDGERDGASDRDDLAEASELARRARDRGEKIGRKASRQSFLFRFGGEASRMLKNSI
jgi:hypothetical protein